MFKVGVIFLGIISYIAACWTTGCNLHSWAEVGCSPFNQIEKSKESCPGGYIYECCDPSEVPSDNGQGESEDDRENEGHITLEGFTKAVTSNGYPTPGHVKYNAFITSASSNGDITTTVELAMALAQFIHESDGLQAKREYACAQTKCPGSYATPGCDAPGQYYFGRGYIQLSWCYNYRPASEEIFGDDRLVRDPDMVARVEQVAWDTAFWYWKHNVHTQPGVSEGRFGVTTRAINGAMECQGANRDKAEARYRIYGKVRAAFGLQGPGIENGCYN